jgi:hypothetical protein
MRFRVSLLIGLFFAITLCDPAFSQVISGSILDGGGQPVGGRIRLYDAVGNNAGRYWVDESGNFETGPLADGTYFAITDRTHEVLDEAWQNIPCENRFCDVTASTPIVISGGNATGIDFILDPILSGGHISGHVQDGSSNPMTELNISIRNSNGQFLDNFPVDPDGNYQTPLLSDDSYLVVTSLPPSGLGREIYNDHQCVPPSDCANSGYIAANGTPVLVSGTDKPGIDFTLTIPPGGLISGRVTDFVTGMPMPDVWVVLIDSSNNPMYGINTDQFGDYYFSGLADGDYKIIAEGVPGGYTMELYGGDHCPDWTCDLSITGTTINIFGATHFTNLDIELDFVGTRIVGTVTRSDTGLPVSSQFAHMAVDLFSDTGEFLGGGSTNVAGQYDIQPPGPGNYYLLAVNDFDYHGLIFEAWDDIKCFGDCNPLNLSANIIPLADGATVVADFVLDPGFRISGMLQFEGAPADGGHVNIWDHAGTYVTTVGHSGDGNWMTGPLPAGTYYATAFGEEWGMVSQLWDGISCPQEFCDVTSGSAIVLAGSNFSGVDFDLAAQSFDWIISGSILDGGGQPVGGGVRLYEPSGQHVTDFWVDESGNFQSWPLADGTYFAVTVFTNGLLDEAWDNIPCENLLCDIPASTPIVIAGADRSGIDFVLAPIASGGSISGHLQNSSSEPLPNVNVIIRNSNGEDLFDVETDTDGNYQTPFIADDSYYVSTRDVPFGLGRELYNDVLCLPPHRCDDPSFMIANGTLVTVSGADRPNIDFTLEIPAGGMISGRVSDFSSGMPMPDIWMILIDEFNNPQYGTTTDRLGDYYFSGLADGDYKVITEGIPHGYTMELYGGDHCPDWTCDLNISGTTINITGATHVTDIDIDLDFVGTRIVGTVTRSDTGAPVSNQNGYMGVDLFTESGDHLGGATTNTAGQYQIDVPGPGNYLLMTHNDFSYHGLVEEAWDDIRCFDNCDPVNLGADVIAVADGMTVVADFVLDPGFQISGTIQFEGVPTGEGLVNIWDQAGDYVTSAGNQGDGNWMSDILLGGIYYATARGEDWGMISQLYDGLPCVQEFCDITAGTPIDLSVSDATGVDFDLDAQSRDWTISGSIKDGSGQGLSGQMRLLDPLGRFVTESWVDHLGHFQTEPLADGTYFAVTVNTIEMLDEAWDNIPCENLLCDIPASTPIVISGADRSGIDFVLDPIVGGGYISGHLEDSIGTPLPYTNVVIRNSNGEYLFDVTTDPDGNYRSQLLANDSYFLNTSNEPFGLTGEIYDNVPCQPPQRCGWRRFIANNGTPVLINNADRTGIDFTLSLPDGGIISGKVVDEDTGMPLPDVFVYLLDDPNGIAHNTDQHGDYYFAGLPDGDYRTYAEDVPHGYTGELFGGDHCDHWNCDISNLGSLINLSGGGLSGGNDISLDYVGTRIMGTVTRSDTNAPVPSLFAYALVDLFNDVGDLMHSVNTNIAGQYQLHLPSAGTYYVATHCDWNYHGLIDEIWQNKRCFGGCSPHEISATPITVLDGTTAVGNFILDPNLIKSSGFE